MASAWWSVLYLCQKVYLMRCDISLLKYLCVGIINSIFGYVIIFILFYVGIIAEVSNFIGYFISIFISFYLNKYYSFKDETKSKLQILKFIISMGVSYTFNLIIMSFSYRVCCINVYTSQILGNLAYLFVGYILSKRWVFIKVNEVRFS